MDNRIKIFIVEDEALIADEIRRAVEGLGYEVCGICYDYAAAAAQIATTDADLFMLDINLSGSKDQTGIALAGLIKSANPRPFIFLTAYSDADTIARATALHPANYLIKPVNPAALFAAIQLAIARVQEPQEAPDADQSAAPVFFYVKIGQRKEKLYWQDVYAMESSKNYVRLFIKGHPGDYPLRGTLAFVLDKLVPEGLRDRYFRLGRSHALSRAHLTEVRDDVVMCGGQSFQNEGRVSAEQLGIL